MGDLDIVNIVGILAAGAGIVAVFSLVFSLINNGNIQSLRFLLENIENRILSIETRSLIEQQVRVAAYRGPDTIHRMSITGKLSDILVNRFNLDELQELGDHLELPHTIDWSTRVRAVSDILDAAERENKMYPLLQYCERKRPGSTNGV